MGKYYEASATFKYSWDQLAKAFWQRYPNPQSIHVLSEDTIFRDIRGESLYTKRLLTKTNRLPKWGERFMKSSNVSVVEESFVDPKNRCITTYTRNVGFTRIMSVVEKVVYTPDPDNPTQTVANRSAWIESQMYGFRRAIEGFGVERFRKNCGQAVQGFNFILNRIYPSGSFESDQNSNTLPTYRLGETTGKIKEKAKRAGEIAKERAGSITSVYAASDEANSDS